MNNFEEYSPFIDLIADTKTNDVNSPVQNEFESYGQFLGGKDEMFSVGDSSEYDESEDLNSVEVQAYEYEEESYTEENIFNNEFDVSPDKGITDYLNVSAVKSRNLKTGVFIPSGYQQSDKIDIVVYLHGLFAEGDKINGIEYYWKKYSNIRDYFYTTRRNAILIAPTLSSNPQKEDVILNQSGGLDKFLTASLKALQTKSYLPFSSNFNKIIIAAHSAGGRPLAKILGYSDVYKEKIVECWGLDCLYADWWANNISQWAKGNKKFYHYWAWSCSAKKLKFCPKVIADKFTDNPNFQNIAPVGKVGHREVIENAWLYSILNRPWFENIRGLMSPNDELSDYDSYNELNFQENSDYFNLNEDFVPDISKAVRLNSYYAQTLGWGQYYDKINDFLLPFSGKENVSLGEEDFAEAVSSWQRQQGFSTKDSDGIIGPNTWKRIQTHILSGTASQTPSPTPSTIGTSGFTFSKYSLSTSQVVIQKKDASNQYAEIRESPAVFLKEIVRNAGEDPQKWFDRFTRITFLGRNFNGGQYVQENLAIHLKQLEKKLAGQFGGANSDPSIAGDALMLTHEGISGSRLVSSTATFSYHMFGLAVDINYTGCPYIQAHDPFNAFMRKVSKLVANVETKGITWNMSIPTTPEKYLKLYDDFFILNNYLKKYFSFLEPQNEPVLNLSLSQSGFAPWNGLNIIQAKELIKKDLKEIANAWKGNRSNPEDIFKNGFLNLSRDFVKGMVESGLDWGARYGDIMHFDMRTTPGIGSRIENAKNRYISAVKAKARKLYIQLNNEEFWDSSYVNVNDEYLVPDTSKAIRLNSYYAQSLGWEQYYDEINDLLLPFSGLQNVSLGEEAFAQAVAAWQQQQGLTPDGIIGPKAWQVMKSFIQTVNSSASVPTQNTSGLNNIYGKLKVNTGIGVLSKSFPEYKFTPEDAVWLARFVVGEAGGQDNTDSHAVIWAMFNRFGTVRHRVPSWTSFSVFLQKYSTTLQPILNSAGAAERVWANYKSNPKANPIVEGNGYYPGTNIKKVQYLRHIILQQKKWEEFDSNVRDMVTRILNGEIINPGIGIATHFLSTYVLLIASRKKQRIFEKPTKNEWIQYTLQFAKNKKLIWIGEISNLNQQKNAFFIQPEFKDVPPNAVRIEPASVENESFENDLRNEPEYLEAIEEESRTDFF